MRFATFLWFVYELPSGFWQYFYYFNMNYQMALLHFLWFPFRALGFATFLWFLYELLWWCPGCILLTSWSLIVSIPATAPNNLMGFWFGIIFMLLYDISMFLASFFMMFIWIIKWVLFHFLLKPSYKSPAPPLKYIISIWSINGFGIIFMIIIWIINSFGSIFNDFHMN